jgi:hypothetical protein
MAVILDNKAPQSPSVFRPEALLRQARGQKRLPAADVPAICILDPDGDMCGGYGRKAGQSLLRIGLAMTASSTLLSWQGRSLGSSVARSARHSLC